MRRTAVMVAAIAAAALGVAGPAGAGDDTKIGVRATEFDLILSRAVVSPGAAEIEYTNQGEDAHDLQIRRRGSEHVYSVTEIPATGPPEEIDLRLKKRSRYVMWCSTLDGKHRMLGMEAELRVKKR